MRRGGGITEPRAANRLPDDLVELEVRRQVGLAKFMPQRRRGARRGPVVPLVQRTLRAGRCVNGAASGVGWKALYIGVAAASYWLIGGRPRISSIVRSTPDVV